MADDPRANPTPDEPARRASPELYTERLILRRWLPGDRAPFAEMCRDPRVMEFMPALLSREESDAMVDRIEAFFDERGFGLWAVEVVGVSAFVGFVGLWVPRIEVAWMPAIEIGWRLAPAHWGHGYATEGGQAALDFGFDVVGLDEIVSFAAVGNERSQRVMQRLGMVRDTHGDFEHPAMPEGDPLRPHVLYRMRGAQRAARDRDPGV
jgi:ribosomal-protein-alanine N-acetyltransferase